MAKPDIPKSMAAKIRSAQNAILDARSVLWIDADEVVVDEARIAEFEANPRAFAEKHYRGHEPDSLKVTTHIERARSSLCRQQERRDQYLAAIKAAHEKLLAVEGEVLAAVEAMKPTKGRVPWPKSIASYERGFATHQRDRERELARDAIEHQRYMERVERDYERGMAASQRISDREDAAERARLARLSPAERAAEREEVRPWREAIERGEITVWDILSGRATLKK